MKSILLGLYLSAFLAGVDLDKANTKAPRAADRAAPVRARTTDHDRIDLTPFAAELADIEVALSSVENMTRDDMLARFGRTSASSGRFKRSSSAYALFLTEFGHDHPYSARIAMRYADSLFPLKFDQIDLLHTPEGPKVEASWRMGYTPDRDLLIRAIHAYDLAASLAIDAPNRGSALLKLGWVYRFLEDWQGSTLAWGRCAQEASGTRSAADALWLAAENLRLTDNAAEAASRLQQLAREYPQDQRASSIGRFVEELEVEASRPKDWSDDPVFHLLTEVETQSPVRPPNEIYRSVVRWLQRRGDLEATVAVSQWACTQEDWPVDARISCRYHLVDALLTDPGEGETRRLEAAERLGEIVDLAPGNAAAVPAALRRYRLLNELGRLDEADQVADEIAARVEGFRRWEPLVLTKRIESLLDRGDKDGAKAVLDALSESYPEFDFQRFDAAFGRTGEEGSR